MKRLPTFEVEGFETRRHAVTYTIQAESEEAARDAVMHGSGNLVCDNENSVIDLDITGVTMTDPGEPDDPPVLLPAEGADFVNDYEDT